MASQGIEHIPTEKEGKWLDPVDWLDRVVASHRIRQGYLALDPNGNSVRLRNTVGGDYTWTTKGKSIIPGEKPEAETIISDRQYREQWPFTLGRRLDKVRHIVPFVHVLLGREMNLIAEIDVFGNPEEEEDPLNGLVIVEVEVKKSELLVALRAHPPGWFGDDVTEDPRYSNVSLATNGMPAR